MTRRKDGKQGIRSTEAEHEARLAACEDAMLSGLSDYRAAGEMILKYGVTRVTATEWCSKVRKRWAAQAAQSEGVDLATARGEHQARLLDIYQRARETFDDGERLRAPQLKVALDAATRLAQLDGLLLPKGPPILPPEQTGDPVAQAVAAEVAQVTSAIREGGLEALLGETPTMPDEADLDPRAAIARLKAEVAALKAKLGDG